MNLIENIAGEICKKLFPINEEIFFGNLQSSLALCTLSSMQLLKEISSSTLMTKIAIAGRLLSENKGIDSLVKYVISNKNIKTIIICGKDTAGHKPGHSLLNLYRNGIDHNGRIINSSSPDPILTLTKTEIMTFQTQVKLIDEIDQTDITKIRTLIDSVISV
ncbi:MAG TPA: tetrahydromethanopterin S-methyltransferase subunit A [Nitrosopumilaceae archaeon]|nr:tetrahydromethanopterin S-methyltransferase subunit A [Nitrosopumilaceae archaeon]